MRSHNPEPDRSGSPTTSKNLRTLTPPALLAVRSTSSAGGDGARSSRLTPAHAGALQVEPARRPHAPPPPRVLAERPPAAAPARRPGRHRRALVQRAVLNRREPLAAARHHDLRSAVIRCRRRRAPPPPQHVSGHPLRQRLPRPRRRALRRRHLGLRRPARLALGAGTVAAPGRLARPSRAVLAPLRRASTTTTAPLMLSSAPSPPAVRPPPTR